jgi:DNA polymerase (family X)
MVVSSASVRTRFPAETEEMRAVVFRMQDSSYVDAKGRTRWRKNDWVAAELKQLGDFLVIGGYEESHALRYGRLAHTISRYPESVETLRAEGRLQEIPGVGETVASMIVEYLETGSCAKKNEWAKRTPLSVLDIVAIPGLGAKTVRALYRDRRIRGLESLSRAIDAGKLDGVKGLGKKNLAKIKSHIEKVRDSRSAKSR